jgi:ElaB/YqjD/DUF883 family membrane-anchored ribosome-binding protein
MPLAVEAVQTTRQPPNPTRISMAADFSHPTPSALEGGPVPKAGGEPTSELMDRVVQGAHKTIDRLAERAAPHVDRLRGGVQDASSLAHEKADDLTRLSDEWAESLRTTVREHPLAAVGTALALGLIVARLTR